MQTSPGCWTDRSRSMSRLLKIVPDCRTVVEGAEGGHGVVSSLWRENKKLNRLLYAGVDNRRCREFAGK
jgi:hypothetical protein